MLRWRLLSATVLISFLSVLLWLDFHQKVVGRPGLWLLPLATLFVILANLELFDLFRAQGWTPLRGLSIGCTVTTFLSPAIPLLWRDYPADCPVGQLGWPLLVQFFGMLVIVIGEMVRFREPGRTLVHVALSSFSIFYLGTLGSFLITLRLWNGDTRGWVALVSMILLVKMSDTGAYFAGRFLGRHQLAPTLSPKKTWEGVVGGVVASVLAAMLFFRLVAPRLLAEPAVDFSLGRVAVYGIILSLSGILGDLAESLLKRDAQIKDAGRRLPGMGGVLDLLDSLLISAPIAYLCWISNVI